jgi:hypothetical protein
MLKFYGNTPPLQFSQIALGGQCPHCKTGTRWSLTGIPNHSKILNEKIAQFVASYSCDSCLGTIGVLWDRQGNSGGEIVAGNPRPLIRTTEPYDFDHVPASVAKEIKEALDC